MGFPPRRLSTTNRTAPAAPDAPAVFAQSWTLVDRHYAFFDHFAIDWAAARARHGAGLTPTSSDAELRGAICRPVNELRSYHAGLLTPAGTCTRTDAPRHPAGYMAEVAERALAALPGVRALVVDVRANAGGDEAVAREIAARLADRERAYRIARFRAGDRHGEFVTVADARVVPAGRRFAGPVAVLLDGGAHGAAEDFAMMMRELPSAVLVGDTTFGTSSNPRTERLANGWTPRIPQSVQTTMDGLVVEGHGVPPTSRCGSTPRTRRAARPPSSGPRSASSGAGWAPEREGDRTPPDARRPTRAARRAPPNGRAGAASGR